MSIDRPSATQPRHSTQRTRSNIISMKLYPTGVKGGVNQFSLDERLTYLKNYGSHCMSFSGLQPGMKYFDIPEVGYITYKDQWGIRAVLSDPVCDRADRETLVREFLRMGEKIEFVQISEGMADLLHDRFGYYCTQFGVEPVIDLQTWNLRGKKKQVLRTSINHMKSENIIIREKQGDSGQMQLTREWLKTRKVKNREISFLVRPMDMDYEEGVRRFFAYLDGELIGFIIFDPMYEGGDLMSYTPNISRFSQRFRQGIFYSLIVCAMEIFKEEGIRYLHLGLCPLVVDEKDKICESKILKKVIRLLFEYGNNLFSFKGLYFSKSRFCGKEYKTFCAHRRNLPLKSFLTMFKIANMI